MKQLALTRDDVAAMRRATSIAFYADSENRAKIRATFEHRHGSQFTATEQRIFPHHRWTYEHANEWGREIRVNGGAHAKGPEFEGRRLIGYHLILASRYCRRWQTIASLMRKGQEVGIHFLGDHSTHDYLRRVDYHADDLVLRIHEGQHSAPREFLIDVQVTPHNSARMIRAEGDERQLTASFDIDDFWREQ